MIKFPFPDKEAAYQELLRDYSYNKIKNENIENIFNIGWNSGIKAADNLVSKIGECKDFKSIAKKADLRVINKDMDRVLGNVRFFSEYVTNKSTIYMYEKSIQRWAKENKLNYDLAYNMILAHEFYHFLEYTKIGLTSKKVRIPFLKIGKFKLGSTGIKALSEIGAHAFVNRLFRKDY